MRHIRFNVQMCRSCCERPASGNTVAQGTSYACESKANAVDRSQEGDSQSRFHRHGSGETVWLRVQKVLSDTAGCWECKPTTEIETTVLCWNCGCARIPPELVGNLTTASRSAV